MLYGIISVDWNKYRIIIELEIILDIILSWFFDIIIKCTYINIISEVIDHIILILNYKWCNCKTTY